jgi:hypothetical protein
LAIGLPLDPYLDFYLDPDRELFLGGRGGLASFLMSSWLLIDVTDEALLVYILP